MERYFAGDGVGIDEFGCTAAGHLVSLVRAGEVEADVGSGLVEEAIQGRGNCAKDHLGAPTALDVVGLLADLPVGRLARGQVGTIVEELDDKTMLVEFSDEQGRAYAIAPCPREFLLVLRYVPETV